ncbi:Ff.00g094580.m01.CDS01 [Fusarium sp. VM40]|nr:Ff.00g094580.m01.CDS01 [Fusarium sp. VM40]
MFQPHPDEQFHLRLHRARSVVLTTQELVEVRAAQRTFEGAYVRTALGQFSFALIILKIFTSEFYAIGALFAVYGVAVMLVAVYRRYEGQNQFFTSESSDGSLKRKFRTSGNSVLLLTVLSLSAYVTLMILTWRLV